MSESLESESFDTQRIAFPSRGGVVIRLLLHTVAGAAPALAPLIEARTGFPFHSAESRQGRLVKPVPLVRPTGATAKRDSPPS